MKRVAVVSEEGSERGRPRRSWRLFPDDSDSDSDSDANAPSVASESNSSIPSRPSGPTPRFLADSDASSVASAPASAAEPARTRTGDFSDFQSDPPVASRPRDQDRSERGGARPNSPLFPDDSDTSSVVSAPVTPADIERRRASAAPDFVSVASHAPPPGRDSTTAAASVASSHRSPRFNPDSTTYSAYGRRGFDDANDPEELARLRARLEATTSVQEHAAQDLRQRTGAPASATAFSRREPSAASPHTSQYVRQDHQFPGVRDTAFAPNSPLLHPQIGMTSMRAAGSHGIGVNELRSLPPPPSSLLASPGNYVAQGRGPPVQVAPSQQMQYQSGPGAAGYFGAQRPGTPVQVAPSQQMQHQSGPGAAGYFGAQGPGTPVQVAPSQQMQHQSVLGSPVYQPVVRSFQHPEEQARPSPSSTRTASASASHGEPAQRAGIVFNVHGGNQSDFKFNSSQ